MKEHETLIQSDSPLSPAYAVCEKTENAVYFYIFYPTRDKERQLKRCWVCNCREAPDQLDAGDKLSMMPKGTFNHAPEGITVHPDGIIWFEDGDSAALLEKGEILAIIPPKYGLFDFPGFAKYAVGQNRYAWELSGEIKQYMDKKMRELDYFWQLTGQQKFWESAQSYHLRIYEEFFGGKHTGYYAIDDNKFPMRAVIEGKKRGVTYGITAFLSMFTQPLIETAVRDAEQHRRIEFGFAAVDALSDSVKTEAYNCFMSLAKYIYYDGVFFAHGHTNTWEGIPGCHAFLFLNPHAISGMESPVFKDFGGDRVNLLWAVPITKEEYDFTVKFGVNKLLACASDPSRVHIFDGRPKFEI